MSRVPEVGSDPLDYSKFTFELWNGLNGKYQFYVERWRRTLEFLRDQHWETLKQYDREVLADWRRFPIQNYTLAFYNDYLTDYLKSEVRFSGIPTSPDPKDIDAAELSEQILKYLWDSLGIDRKKIDLGAWVMACGTGAVRVYWNTNTGNPIPLAIPGEDGSLVPIDPATLQPASTPVMVDSGDIGFEVISPQFVRWAENPAHGVMVGILLSYEMAKAFYGKENADKLTYSDTHQGISADLNSIEQPGVTPSTDKRALVIEHYLPKSAMHPQGKWWTAAQNGKMILHTPWPLPGGKIPIVSFRWIPMPGEDHIGVSPLYGITFENKVYEEVTAKILEWYQKAKPKVLLKSGGGLTHGDLTDEPFQELVVNQGGEPEPMLVADAPAGLFRILQLLQNDMTVSSGRAFAEGDQIPEGLATQRIRQPSELLTSKSTTTAHVSAKASWKEVGEILMYYVANFYTEPRVVAIQGPDRGFLWREFVGSDLLNSAGGLAAAIQIEEIPLFPQNRQNLRDTVIALLQSQAGQILFSAPDGQLDMDRIKGALKATGLDQDLDILDPDVMEARNEIVEFQNFRGGQPPQPQPWQNSLVHWEEKTKVLKGQRFRSWNPAARDAFLQNVQAHEEILNKQAKEEADAMVEQEKALRRVREQEELRADVMKQWAVSLIELVKETTGLEVEDILSRVQREPSDITGEV